MHTRRLGTSDLMITPLGFGSWAIGGAGWPFAWGHQDDSDSIAAIHEALDLGINWIDTAPVYGLGHSEEMIRRALATVPASRRPLLFTKCGRVWNDRREVGKRLTAASIRAECEASLRRLGVEHIDLYQIHWPEPDDEIEEGWAECARLRAAGKVGWIGVSNFNVAQLERAAAIAPVTSLQPPYSLLRREIEGEILPWCQAHGVGVLAYSPMASGLLTGSWSPERFRDLPADDWRKEKNPLFQEPRFSAHLAFVECLRSLAADRGVAVGALALAWVLGQAAVTAAIVGARRPGQLGDLVAAADLRLLPDEREAITALVPV
jgi:aryl-alcohol dehydrogenase-like predicted oxidoreductase